MSKYLLTEEEVRAKVVLPWLAAHGFGPDSILLERSFEIHTGGGAIRINGNTPLKKSKIHVREDVLVRSIDGRNLFIVEIKAPNEKLTDEARDQAICYARLLREGGIAPFVLVTNSIETRCYDSITREEITGQHIPPSHPYARNKFRVSADSLTHRAEALRSFISLSMGNLLEFCREQVSRRMRILRGEDTSSSNKKYIPSLHIKRQDIEKDLQKRLLRERRPVVFVIGPPQVGKTGVICNTVEQHLKEGRPCLFYPAIGLRGGLLDEIAHDLAWVPGHAEPARAAVAQLFSVLRSSQHSLIIFVDGWNEATAELARTIEHDADYLNKENSQIVVSFTSASASRLLQDEAGNPVSLAESASLGPNAAKAIELDAAKMQEGWSTVYVTKFSEQEVQQAYQVYSTAFNVLVPSDHRKTDDPFLLRIAMEAFSNKRLPIALDEPRLIEQILDKKAERAVDLKAQAPLAHRTYLRELALEMLSSGAPVQRDAFIRRLRLPLPAALPRSLFEAGLLAETTGHMGAPALDFYYHRERDFVIAYWARDWAEFFSAPGFADEIHRSGQNQALVDALTWFLSQPQNLEHLENISSLLTQDVSPTLWKIVLDALHQLARKQVAAPPRDSRTTGERPQRKSARTKETQMLPAWTYSVIQKALDSPKVIRINAVKLLPFYMDGSKTLSAELRECDRDLIASVLELNCDYPFLYDEIGLIILDELRDIHFDITDGESSALADALVDLLDHEHPEVSGAAACVLGHINAEAFLDELKRRAKELNRYSQARRKGFQDGLTLAVHELNDAYYGSMCPGIVNIMEDDPSAAHYHYLNLLDMSTAALKLFGTDRSGLELQRLLESVYDVAVTSCSDEPRLLAALRPPKSRSPKTRPPKSILKQQQLGLFEKGRDDKDK